jgi:hypothetical protein
MVTISVMEVVVASTNLNPAQLSAVMQRVIVMLKNTVRGLAVLALTTSFKHYGKNALVHLKMALVTMKITAMVKVLVSKLSSQVLPFADPLAMNAMKQNIALVKLVAARWTAIRLRVSRVQEALTKVHVIGLTHVMAMGLVQTVSNPRP